MEYVITNGTQGICPGGWHLPTDAEWCELENEVDVGTIDCSWTGWRGSDAGGNLKEVGTTHWNAPNDGATNSSGFTALPGGYRDYVTGSLGSLGDYAFIWSSTEGASVSSWFRMLGKDVKTAGRNNYEKTYGFSVRCIKD